MTKKINKPLKDRDWSYPLERLDREFDKHYDDITAEKFHIARGDFLREWRFMEIIWNRLQHNYRIFYESRSQFKEATTENFKHNVRIGRCLMQSLDCIHLDTNCLILNARILMDGIARLTTLFWEKIAKEEPNWRSFKDHKAWFKNPNNRDKIVDEVYSRYITQRTNWFKKLKIYRDKIIVHRSRDRNSFYIDVFKEKESGAIMLGKVDFNEKDKKIRYNMEQIKIPDLNELLDMRIDLNQLLDSICDFLDFFDEHFSQLL